MVTRLRTSLNTIRAAAAIYVVLHHLALEVRVAGVPVGLIFKFGQEAVMVFFLLSGFLIFRHENVRVLTDLRGYYLRRIRRVYPPLIVALALSTAIAWLGGYFAREFDVGELVFTMLSMQDLSMYKPGTISDPFLSNLPLWSLSYEVLFYLVFPIIARLRTRSRMVSLHAVGGVSLVGYLTYLAVPNHFSIVFAYLLVWWCGAFIADLHMSSEMSFRSSAPLLVYVGLVISVAISAYILNGRADLNLFLLQSLRMFIFTAGCVVIAVSPFARIAVAATSHFPAAAAYLASISYGLYLFHYPLLNQWEFAQTPGGLVVALLLLIGLSVVGDRYLDRIIPRPRNRASDPPHAIDALARH